MTVGSLDRGGRGLALWSHLIYFGCHVSVGAAYMRPGRSRIETRNDAGDENQTTGRIYATPTISNTIPLPTPLCGAHRPLL